MKTNILHYNVIIQKEGKDFIAYVPSLGISDFGPTVERAKQNVHEAITIHIQGMIKTGNEVPPPDSHEFYVSQSQIKEPKGIRFAV